MQVRCRSCEAIESEDHVVRGAADVRRVMIAFLGRKVQRCRFIGEQPADKTLSVLHDPPTVFVTANDEAWQHGSVHMGRAALELM